MWRVIVISASILCFVGCATQLSGTDKMLEPTTTKNEYYKEGVSSEQAFKDDYECLKNATVESSYSAWTPAKIYRMCMEAKGYTLREKKE